MADRLVGPNMLAIMTDYGLNITCCTTRQFLMVFRVLCVDSSSSHKANQSALRAPSLVQERAKGPSLAMGCRKR